MKILLLGEASFVHSTLRDGFRALGHDVVLMSGGNNGRGCPRDIDLERNMKWGKLGGLVVLFKLIRHIRLLVGNDVVQVHNSQFVPLRMRWNEWIFAFLKRFNKKTVRLCLGDDNVVMDAQACGQLAYSDTHIGMRPINVEENAARLAEQHLPEYVHAYDYVNRKADILVPVLYEYYKNYELLGYKDKIHYIALPMELAGNLKELVLKRPVVRPVKVLVGIQTKRDYLKGAAIIGALVERVARENPGMIEVTIVRDVPYYDYLKLLDDTDVLVDQLYSFTPSMNSLAAMAHGTVVIGGGEDEYYDFIGEKSLRPIINVRPEDDDYNLGNLRSTLLNPEKIADLKRQGMEFVNKHHDYIKVCEDFIRLYGNI